MAVDAIGGISLDGTTTSNNAIDQEEFVKLFLAQLNFQDPLEPVDNREFLTQMAQFSQLQVANEQKQSLLDLVSFHSVNQGVNMLGKTVNIKDQTESGVVQGIHFDPLSNTFSLTVKTASGQNLIDVPLGNVSSVIQE